MIAWSGTNESYSYSGTLYTKTFEIAPSTQVYSDSGTAIAHSQYSISGISIKVGRGVIYRMIDEFGNDVPYDFKNILFSFSSPQISDLFTFNSSSGSTDISLDGSCHENKIEKYCDDSGKQELNFTVFSPTSSSYKMCKNKIGLNNKNNVIRHNFKCNLIGANYQGNIITSEYSNHTYDN